MRVKLSKSEWLGIGKTAGWVRDMTIEDDRGDPWDIEYKSLEPEDLYDENGKSLSREDLMKKMIVRIQHKFGDEEVRPEQFDYFFEKIKLDPAYFFDKLDETNRIYMDEQRIEQRDIDMGLHYR